MDQKAGMMERMVHAFKLYSGPDNASHVIEGTVALDERAEVVAVHFAQSPPHASLDWHDAPQTQYVITLSGTLEFTTRDGETFVLRPGDILIAADDAGSGHRWRLIDDQPWLRCYVVIKPGSPDLFVPQA
jgi:quercetin dioxygenase-like cupin family protein